MAMTDALMAYFTSTWIGYNKPAQVEVEQVTHIFSQETGFVTVITPDLAEGLLLGKRPKKNRALPANPAYFPRFFIL